MTDNHNLRYEVKYDHIHEEFKDAPYLLRHITHDFIRLANQWGIMPVITRVLDPVKGESGVHNLHRGLDIRDHFGRQQTYSEAQRNSICDYLNAKYYRNDGFSTIISHEFKGGPRHFHIQIAHETIAYMPSSARLEIDRNYRPPKKKDPARWGS